MSKCRFVSISAFARSRPGHPPLRPLTAVRAGLGGRALAAGVLLAPPATWAQGGAAGGAAPPPTTSADARPPADTTPAPVPSAAEIAPTAADVTVTTTQNPAATAPTPAAPAQLDAIVVRGEKLGRSRKDTATSVAVFTARSIEDQGDQNLGDLLRRAANTTANEEGNISIRGVSQQGAAGGTGSPLISVQVDGVTLDRTSQQGATDELFDVAQVEVLRGAQSTSQGRNALAGAVVINTREPTRAWDTRGRVVVGSRDARETSLATGGPLGENFAFRLVGSNEYDAGFITNVFTGNPDFAESRKSLGRAKLAFTPTFLPGFDSLLTLGADRADGQPDYNQERGTAGTDPAQRRTSRVNVPTRDLTNSRIGSLRNRLRLGEHYTVTAITAGMRTRQDYVRDFDGLEEQGGENTVYSRGHNVSQEIRLNLKDVGRFTGVVGVYGGRFVDDFSFTSNDVRVAPNQLVGASIPVTGDVTAVSLDFFSQQKRDARNLAGFTEFDIKLPYRLTATLGLRYDRENLDTFLLSTTTRADAVVLNNGVTSMVPLAGTAIGAVPGVNVLPALAQVPGLLPTTNGPQRGSTRYSALLPKAGLRFALTPRVNLFATYAEAYRAGGVDVDTTNGRPLPYDPEYTRNYETGLKAETADGRFDTATSLYYTDWRNQQVLILRGQLYVTQNAARSRLFGAEASVGWRPVRGLRLEAGAGYTNTRFLDYRVPGADYGGHRFIFAPLFTGSVGFSWRPAGGLRGLMVASTLSFRGKAFTTPANVETERSDARGNLDARVGYESNDGQFRVYAFGRNLADTDKITETYQFPAGYVGAPGARGYAAYTAPRFFGVQVEERF